MNLTKLHAVIVTHETAYDMRNRMNSGYLIYTEMYRKAFTLIELLVVIAIIAILAAIMFPVLSQARVAAKKSVNMSNLRQIGIGIQMYLSDQEGFPMMSSPSSQVPRTRWPDHMYPYVKNTDIFRGPLAPPAMFSKAFAHAPSVKFGGYGYNYQYLGNSRFVTGNSAFPFTASESAVEYPADTVVIADTMGVRRANNTTVAGEYTIDPPLSSSRGSGKASGYYGEGAECGTGPAGCRSLPAEWTTGRVTIAWADGHAGTKKRQQLDDKDGNGTPDNGYWNGLADAAVQ